ncbi:MAG: DUF1624 domain-containing protein [Ruminococcaceae bacterium]|nr:DUF1624 domain-containing protein [Oscillospiraceae bacterium]
MKKRIWELDVLRGICILGVLVVHFIYDLVQLYQLVQWEYPPLFSFIKQWGGVLFLLLSGICVTLGSHSVRRGIVVFACGLIISAVTYGMYHFGFADKIIIIYFGVLHCLGTCMLLWPTYKNTPWWGLLFHGLFLVVLGLYLDGLLHSRQLVIDSPWLISLGLPPQGFASSDYFPLLPNLGFFLIGSAIGKTLYKKKESLLPMVRQENVIVRFFSFFGRHSLWVYLLHQPLLAGIFYLITLF